MKLIEYVFIIGGVAIATVQLTQLLPVNTSYEAGWWKFALASLLAIAGFVSMNGKIRTEKGRSPA